MLTDGDELLDEPARRAVEGILGQAAGERRRIVRQAATRPGDGRVVRVVDDAGDSWIVKRSLVAPGDDRLYEPWGFYAEWVASALVASRAPAAVAPFFGGSAEERLMVFGDLGPGPDGSQVLRGEDADTAAAVLAGMGATLGGLHAATAGGEGEYLDAWSRLCGARPVPRLRRTDSPIALAEAVARHIVEPAGIQVPENDMAELWTWAAEGGEPRTLLHGDPCLDNWILDGDGTPRLIDFQGAVWGPAALDAAYARAPLPTCWCVRRFPPEVVDSFEASHRAAVGGVGQAEHAQEVARACAWWMIGQLLWRLGPAERDEPAGEYQGFELVPHRAAVLMRIDSFVAASSAAEVLGELAAWAGDLRAMLTSRWGSAPVALFPPFEPQGDRGRA